MNRAGTEYDQRFFDHIGEYSLRSAREIVPLVVELFRPRSVVDVGCGDGTWLSVFVERGVQDILGLDGDYVDQARLRIDPRSFEPCDLSRPFEKGRPFDLVVSLEVGEHLAPDAAAGFVRSLTALGRRVLFSAAVPQQSGTGHVNEQWPSYWARLFQSQGYRAFDCVRARVWDNPRVAWWYAQNTIIYVGPGEVGPGEPVDIPLSLVHPRMYQAHRGALERRLTSPRGLLASLPGAVRAAVGRRFQPSSRAQEQRSEC